MTLKEANRIIAEYMRLDYPAKNDNGFYISNPDFTSLDALTLIWSIYKTTLPKFERRRGRKGWIARAGYGFEMVGSANTIQEAAAIATAKALLELKGES